MDHKVIRLKRAFDLLIGIPLAILLIPLLLLISLLIKLDSSGPVIYKQERLGWGGKKFTHLKFRTMITDADHYLDKLLKDPQTQQEYVVHHKISHDPRVTRIGRFLRRYSLDELPQIWSVLTGEMSLVGPRAYQITEQPDMGEYRGLIFQARPGMTGWWQVNGRHANTFEHRLQLDNYYLTHWSLGLDIYILMKTIWVVINTQGI